MVNVFAVVKEGLKQTIEHPIDSLKQGFSTIGKAITQPSPKGVAGFVVPQTFPSPISGAKATVGAVSKVGGYITQGAKSAYKAVTTARLPPLKNWALGTAGLLGMHEAFKAGKASMTGERFNPVPSYSDVLRSAGGALSLPSTIAGSTVGFMENLKKGVIPNPKMPWEQPVTYGRSQADALDLAIDKIKREVNVDKIPSFNMPFQLPSVSPQTSVNMTMPEMTMPSTSIGMPSISVGGGMGGMDMALIALMLGGAGGYLVGRKRKKKRYKKRKRR